jgi:hypothetical protein
MTLMKKLLTTLLGLSLLLSACGGSDTDEASTTDSDEVFYFTYVTAEFSIDVPDDWETINAFTSDYPDEVRVAFRNNLKDSEFIANVSIVREDYTGTSADYAQSKLDDHSETLINYKLESQEAVTLEVAGADSVTTLNTFRGKNEASSPTLEYMQIYLTKGDNAWTVSASYTPNEDEFVIERMAHMLKSFTLK